MKFIITHVSSLRAALVLLALFTAGMASADDNSVQRTVDLRDAAALEQLRQTNPAHYTKIERILDGLSEHPERVESKWLQTNFDARDIDLSRLILKTSYPPRQLLRFTLEDTRYLLHVVRSDLVAHPETVRQPD